MSRIEGWEGRLIALIEEARHKPYELGTHDCFRLACRTVEALTGIDRWPEFSGYKTRKESLAKLAKHGSTFERAGNWFFGVQHTDWKFSSRGDIACIELELGDKHLGIVIDDRIAFLSDQGLVFLQIDHAVCVWRVG